MAFRLRSALPVALLLLIGASNAQTDWGAGLDAWRAGDRREAGERIARVVREDPGNSGAHALLGRIALARGELSRAAGEFDRAVDLGYPAGALRHLRAEALLAGGDPAGALAEAAHAPRAYAAYAARIAARALIAQGDRDGAARAIAEAGTLGAGAGIHLEIARLRLASGDFAGATYAADRAVSAAPRNPDALLLAANLVRDRYGPAAAMAWYERTLAVDPGNRLAWLDKAATLGELGRYRDMLAATRAALAIDPGAAMAWYLQAVIAARAGNWSLARTLLDHAGGRLDGLAGMRLLRGTIAEGSGAHEAAITALQPLVDSQPGNRTARRLLGIALWRSGDGDGAIATLTPIADESAALIVMARAAEAGGDRIRAADWLDRADRAAPPPVAGPDLAVATAAANIKLNQASAAALAAALIRADRAPDAARIVDTWLEQHPQDVAMLRAAGNDALMRHSWARAAMAFATIRTLTGAQDAASEAGLAWAHAALGRADALALAANGYRLAPGSPGATAAYAAALQRSGQRDRARALRDKAAALGR